MNKPASDAGAFVHRLSQELPHHAGIQIGLTPPFTALHAVREALGPASAVLLGAQNLYWEDKGEEKKKREINKIKRKKREGKKIK